MSKHILDLTIAAKHELPGGMWLMTFRRADGGALPELLPGQFAQLRVDGTPSVMLRRPISICDFPDPYTVKMLIKPVGDGTRHITSQPEGSTVNMLLPLGNTFTTASPGERVLLVGGGVGCAPLVLLCRRLVETGAEVTVALGGRSKADVEGLAAMYPGARVVRATDDGSLGHHGLVTTLPEFTEVYDRIYTCGPTPMMRAVAKIAASRAIWCEVSLENMMACGLGACLCCVEKTVKGNVCVCTEGPVFNIDQLTWQ